MVDIKSCFVLGNRENIKLEKELAPEEGEIVSLQQVHMALCTLHDMRKCMKNKAGREYDCMTAYTDRTGRAARHTEKQDCSRDISRTWRRLPPEERKRLVNWEMTGPLHTAAWLFPVVTQPRLCRTLQGSWEFPLRNQLLLAAGVSPVEICCLGVVQPEEEKAERGPNKRL